MSSQDYFIWPNGNWVFDYEAVDTYSDWHMSKSLKVTSETTIGELFDFLSNPSTSSFIHEIKRRVNQSGEIK